MGSQRRDDRPEPGGHDHRRLAATGKYLAVKAISLPFPVKLTDVKIVGPNASGAGASSYGVVVISSTVALDTVIVNGGNGAAGSPGSAGTSATQTAAATGGAGGDGLEANVACDPTTRGAGGPAATNGAVGADASGGVGGAGGTMDTSCNYTFGVCICESCNARAGDVGINAPVFQALAFGMGGAGRPFKASSCESGVSGSTGFPAVYPMEARAGLEAAVSSSARSGPGMRGPPGRSASTGAEAAGAAEPRAATRGPTPTARGAGAGAQAARGRRLAAAEVAQAAARSPFTRSRRP